VVYCFHELISDKRLEPTMADDSTMRRTFWVVDDLHVDPGSRSVKRDGQTIDLPRLSFDLLLELIRTAPDALSTDALMDRVWQGAVVSPATVAKRVELLRQALGDDSGNPRYVALVRGYGYRLVPEPQREFSAPARGYRQAGRGFRWRLALAFLATLLVLTIAIVALQRPEPELPSTERTIAVLPFESLTTLPGDQQFADGLTEEIAHALARSGELRVAGRSSSLRFRGTDESPVAIGKSLGVAHLLEGTVRRSDDRLRVVVHLTDTDDGLARWSETWDRPMQEALTIQRDIAERVSAQLAVALFDGAVFGDGPVTEDVEAFTLYLKAKSLMEYPFGSDLPLAQGLLEQAVVLDPEFAEAWAHLGVARLRRTLWREPTYTLAPEDSLAIARDAIDRALAADPAVGFAYGGLAGIAWAFEDDIAKAARMTEQFMRFSPWELSGFTFAADLLRSLGRLEQARLIEEHVLERDPLCSYCRVAHFATLLGLGDYEAAEQQARLLLVTDPEVDLYAYHLGKALLLGGKAEEALDVFDTIGDVGLRLAGRTMADYSLGRESNSARQWAQLDARSPDTPGPYVCAQVAAWLGHDERALELRGWARLLERIGRSPEQVRAVKFDVTHFLESDE
jgi:TolB-like protein/DNA-binding winged helix-turn-helix (wHTH) protein